MANQQDFCNQHSHYKCAICEQETTNHCKLKISLDDLEAWQEIPLDISMTDRHLLTHRSVQESKGVKYVVTSRVETVVAELRES